MKKHIYLAASLLMFAANVANAQFDNTLLGAGSSFDYPLFSKMFSEYDQKASVKVNYQSIGSGGGIKELTNKTVDFGASDAPLNDEQAQKIAVPALHIPVTAGAVVVSYNLPGVKNLKLTGSIVSDIFLGKITKWDDARIKAVNKGVTLPSTSIIIAHRAEGSGTTNIFTTYLSKVSSDWDTKVGKGSSVNWPAGLGAKGNEGVAGLISQTPGCIGYIELAYAIQNKLAYASIENKSHKFITPTVKSTSSAANINIPADGKVSLTNTDAADGYPISGFSWVIIYKEQNYNNRSADRTKAMLKLLWWMIHDGQKYSSDLNYAPLPKAAITVGERILKSATYNGKAIL
ncbi:MAG TPA: phosphate ABC transporter substrate-binding protein PstS [Flavipsychrobacter sp.]|nr:phosphate ABC transporter substrate-binding protein PstS [Flavipsychrobacter sp.]